MKKGCLWFIVGGVVLVVLIGILAAIFGGDSGSNESAGPTAPATPPPESAGPTAPATPPPQMSAQALLAEREANATRFDDTFKGKWVTVSGQIEKIDGGKVYLRGDGFLSDVVLEDLSADKQIPLNVGEEFSATCKVGNYILGTIFLNSCFGGDSGSNESAGPTAPTPIDLATTRVAPMFIEIVDSRSGRQEASVDVAQDYDEFDIDVFIEMEEFCNSTRVYGDEGFYALSCASLSLDSHTDVERVSVQTPSGDLRCARNALSDELRTVFACGWR